MSEADSARTINTTMEAQAGETAESAGFHTAGVVTIGAGHAVHDTFTGFVQPLLPTFITNLALSNAQAGLLTVFMQWPSLFQPFLGHIADRISLRKFFVLAPTVTAVAMSLLGIAPTYAVLAMLMVVAGLSSAMLHAAGPAVVGKLSGPKLGRGMGFWMVGGELGRTLGPLTIVTAVQFIGLKGTPWLMIAGPITSVLLFIILKNVPDVVANQGHRLTRDEMVRGWGPMLLPMIGVIVASSFMVASLSTYLPIFLTGKGSSLWLAGASLSVYQVAGVVGALSGGVLSDRFGRRKVIVSALAIPPLLMFVFLGAAGWSQYLLLLLLGFVSLALMPVFMAVMQERFPQNRAFAIGVYLALSFLIRSGVVVILGAVADRWDMQTAFIVSAAVGLLGVPFAFFLPTRAAKNE